MLMPDMRTDTPESLVFDLVEWVAKEPRTYAQVMDAWRTSCPRLTVWEEALERGYLVRKGTDVAVTEPGRAFLQMRTSVIARSEATKQSSSS
jgi:hypothetical protein